MPDQETDAVHPSDAATALSDQAIDRLTFLGSGRATDRDRADFAAWRALSPEHEAAAHDAEAMLRDLGETRAASEFRARSPSSPRLESGQVRRRSFDRRALLGGALAASAAAVIFWHGAVQFVPRLYSDHVTGVGEHLRVPLSDGSVALLNTSTAISVEFVGNERRIRLHDGEAAFEVAPYPQRPFIVEARNGETQAIATAFMVRLNGGEADVTVTQGVVEVRGARKTPVRVAAGQHVIYDAAALNRPEPTDITAAAAWQRGKLMFNRRPLGEVVAELQRYHTGPIVFLDGRQKELILTGVFDLAEPDSLLRAVETTTAARIVRLPFLTIIH